MSSRKRLGADVRIAHQGPTLAKRHSETGYTLAVVPFRFERCACKRGGVHTRSKKRVLVLLRGSSNGLTGLSQVLARDAQGSKASMSATVVAAGSKVNTWRK